MDSVYFFDDFYHKTVTHKKKKLKIEKTVVLSHQLIVIQQNSFVENQVLEFVVEDQQLY